MSEAFNCIVPVHDAWDGNTQAEKMNNFKDMYFDFTWMRDRYPVLTNYVIAHALAFD